MNGLSYMQWFEVRAVCIERCTYGSEGGSLYWVPTQLTAELVTWKNGSIIYICVRTNNVDGQFIDLSNKVLYTY